MPGATGKKAAASKPAALEDMIRAAKKPAAITGKAATASGKAATASGKAALHAIVLPGNNHQMLLDALARRPWWHVTCEKGLDASSSDFWWGGNGQPFAWKDAVPRTLVNKMSVHGGLVVKSRLALNLRRYARAAKIDPASLVPLSFVLTAGPAAAAEQSELSAFRDAAAAAAANGEKIWIVKPGHGNRGHGIKVLPSAKMVEAHLRTQKPGSAFVVQKYIERPLLLGDTGRKFDIRQFVLVTHDYQVWMYRDSYVRTCTDAYEPGNTSDLGMHLTNDYVQKTLPSFGQFEDSNKLSFEQLQALLDARPLPDGTTLSVQLDIWPRMRTIVAHTFACVIPLFASAPSRGHSFELYGLDFMVTDDGAVLLIEANTSPALFQRGAYLTEMLPRLIEETFQKAIDQVHPPPPSCPAEALPQPLDRFELVEVPSPLQPAVQPSRAGAAAAIAPAASAVVPTAVPTASRDRGVAVAAGGKE
tara:strand:- start:75 stop:1499 length:1425 start_codon:yes stop_codon:yes gene_type:complete